MVSAFDELLPDAARIVELSLDYYRAEHTIAPFAVVWLAEPARSDDGTPLNSVFCELSDQDSMQVLRTLLARTKARGLVLVQPHDNAFFAVFETTHGARSWTVPLERHGDVLVLASPQMRDNAGATGALYRPN